MQSLALQVNWYMITQKHHPIFLATVFSFLFHFFFLQLSSLLYLFSESKLSTGTMQCFRIYRFYSTITFFLFHYRCNTLIVPFCRPICSSMTPLTVHLKVLFMLWMIRPWRSMGRRSQLQAKGNVDICHCTRIIWFDCYCAKLSLVFVYCAWHRSLAILLTRLDFWVLMDIYLCFRDIRWLALELLFNHLGNVCFSLLQDTS